MLKSIYNKFPYTGTISHKDPLTTALNQALNGLITQTIDKTIQGMLISAKQLLMFYSLNSYYWQDLLTIFLCINDAINNYSSKNIMFN